MKGQVDYRLPKKMKKRRQLDALVDTVKLPRTRKNSASVQELLDSDSSENDEFSLQPPGSKRKNRCCVWQSIAAQIGLFMVTTACLTTCVGLVWVQWHIRHELDSLRKQMTSVENSDKASTELLKFQSQLAEVNTSVLAVRAGPGGLQEMTNTLAQVHTQLKALEAANKELQASVSASKDLLNLPNKVDTLSNTLASLGSDTSRLDKDMQALQDGHFENRIAALENSMKEKNPVPSISSDRAETVTFNETLHSGLQSLRQELDQFSARISVLEKFTSQTQSALDTTRITELINQLLQEKMGNLTAGDQGSSNVSQPSQVPADVLTDKAEFLAFKADILDSFEKVNETVVILNQELEAIATRLDSHDVALINLTSAVLRVSRTGAEHQPGDEGTTTTSTSTGSPRQESASDASTAGPAIKITGINSLEDLHSAFSSWPLQHGQVSVDSLEGVQFPVNKDQLKQFDSDHNGFFSEQELAEALGLHHNPR
ncbi:hypothetical protein BsWGS_02586 [Bradybaena similaris]